MRHSFIVYSVLGLLVLAQPAFAQEAVGVRTGEHSDYSRLVFDWDKTVEYSIDDSQPGKLVIGFKNQASVKNPEALSETLKNFSGVRVLSDNPLRLEMSIPQDSRTRSFFAGDRLVVDIYNSPSGARPAGGSAAVAAAPEPESVVETPPPAEPEKEEPPVKEVEPPPQAELASTKSDEPVQGDDEAIEVGENKAVARDEVQSAEEKPQITKAITKQKKIPSNLIAFTSTKSFGLAAFEMGGALWMVNDQGDLALEPQVRGPDAAYFDPIEAVNIERGTAFKTKILDGASIRGEGGGLLWRVVISRGDKKYEPITAKRENLREGRVRSGTLLFPFKTAQNVLEVLDPVSGASAKVVTVDSPKDFAGPAQDFVDFQILPSAIGLAVLPKVDDLSVEITKDGVLISRPAGLSLTPQSEVQAGFLRKERHNMAGKTAAVKPRGPDVFDFKNWELGGISSLEENSNVILSSLNDLPEGKKIEDVIMLAKMHLANGMAPEALGFLKLAKDLLPGVENSPEFEALNAAAYALVSKSESAFTDLSRGDLEKYGDIPYWQAYTLADLGDWQQAEEVLPADLLPLQDYPKYIYNRIAPNLAEVALRSGNVAGAEQLLSRLEAQDDLWEPQKAALLYLKGEAERQKGNKDETKKLWEELVVGKDDFYRARAGLALTRLQTEEKEITPQQAIDKLERLRYAWRGDELEAQINYWLGKTYFENGEHGRGLNILREAASYAVGTPLSRRITAEMSDMFTNLFLTDQLAEVSPVEATALYEQFAELVPSGEQGDKVVEKLAERLVQADLLGRASDMLQYQIDHRLSGLEAYRVAVRLVAIELIDNRPAEALQNLKKASAFLQGLPEELQTPERFRELSLLRARGLSKQGRPDQALALLNDLEANSDVNRLKADIAWNAGYWDDAAEALGDVIFDKNISLTRPLEDEDKAIILKRAVALNLAGDRIALANMREKYSDLMAQTDKAKVFEVITRARQSAALADRQTLMNVAAETDLFADFLNSYKATPPESN
ncbi:MAG: tetratricopeptide repeat protein [Alphaproteobacteria bacterium]|nr:tetratricopeptide repeat protein [Alphaproteobacteria bacterium]